MIELMTAAAEAAQTAKVAVSAATSNLYFCKALTLAGGFAAMGFAAMGSSYGAGLSCSSAIGAWKKCYAQNKPAPFQLLVFGGAPLSQVIYGMIIMFVTISNTSSDPALYSAWPAYLLVGTVGGIAMGLSALFQGMAAAAACDAFAENGKGFTNQLMALGIIETIAIFIMAFSIVLLGSIPVAA